MTMVFASVMSVNAAETATNQDSEGKGAAEGYVNKYVQDVVLPTNALDFVVDPQGLIKASNSGQTKYKATIVNTNKELVEKDDGFVYFTTTETSGKTTTTKKSGFIDLVVENRSSYDVKITPKLTYTDGKVGKAAMGCSATLNAAAIGKTNLLFNLYLKEEKTETDPEGTSGDGTDGSSTSTTQSSAAKEYDYTLVTAKKGKTPVVPNTLNGISNYYATTFDTKAGYKYALNTDKNKGPVYANLTADEKAVLNNIVTYTLEGSSNPASTNWDAVVTKMNTKSTEDVTVVQPALKITWTITDIK